ncbi:MAG: hypothetical protein KJ067_07210 [Vicinamibacteria bacterium]|nr:hypothetical protein [Vicinamibacteria bacterium]
MKARALPARRNRRSTRGQGRHVHRRPRLRVAPAATLPEAPRVEEQNDESLYRLGDGSDLPTLDVRADVGEVAQ